MKKHLLSLFTFTLLIRLTTVDAGTVDKTLYNTNTSLMTTIASCTREPKNVGYRTIFDRELRKTPREAINMPIGVNNTRPLLEATRAGDLHMVQALMTAGANPSLKDDQGNDAFTLAKTLPFSRNTRKIVKAIRGR